MPPQVCQASDCDHFYSLRNLQASNLLRTERLLIGSAPPTHPTSGALSSLNLEIKLSSQASDSHHQGLLGECSAERPPRVLPARPCKGRGCVNFSRVWQQIEQAQLYRHILCVCCICICYIYIHILYNVYMHIFCACIGCVHIENKMSTCSLTSWLAAIDIHAYIHT